MTIVHYHTIEPSSDGDGYWLVAHGEYEQSSVLAGQQSRCLTQWYATLSEAMKDNPGVEVLDYSTRDPFAFLDNAPLPDTPPDWFDPLDAGEVWHEDDY